MLRYFRENNDSLFSRFILALLSLVFIFFFGYSALTAPRTKVVAEVNGEAIRDTALNRLARRQIQFQRLASIPRGCSGPVRRIKRCQHVLHHFCR